MSVSDAAAPQKVNLEKTQRSYPVICQSITFSTEVRGFVVPGGVHQLNGSKIIQRSEILKKYLNNGQKQREALKALQNVMEQTKPPSSQCLFPSITRRSFTVTALLLSPQPREEVM